MVIRHYDLIIIGGGVSGTALLYLTSHYSNIKSIALLEKYDQVAKVNSLARNNSQTLHCGDIETNYSLDKAKKVQKAANMIVHYANSHQSSQTLLYKMPKMVLAIGETEIEVIKNRAQEFSETFPYMKLLDKQAIDKIEPNVTRVNGSLREDDILAFGCESHGCAVNFAELSRSFLAESKRQVNNRIDVIFNTKVESIKKNQDLYHLKTNGKNYTCNAVVVNACGHSLLLAQKMGFGKNFSCLPVAGSFYLGPELLNGKVYRVQNNKLPFAAIHGDRDFTINNQTRFGPTALLLPMLERYQLSSVLDFLRVLHLDRKVIRTLWDIMKDKDIRNYIFRNFKYEIPLIRRRAFLKEVKKIVPSLKVADLKYARRFGGVRPQLIDKEACKLIMGEAKIDPGDGIIFNMTPSPGASSCMDNAENDMRIIAAYLNASINEDKLNQELAPNE